MTANTAVLGTTNASASQKIILSGNHKFKVITISSTGIDTFTFYKPASIIISPHKSPGLFAPIPVGAVN